MDLQDMIHELTYYLELIIAIIMSIIIAVMTFKLLAVAVPDFFVGEKIELGFFLEKAMMLAIGLEFVKMLCKHTPSTIIDVLLFAIARQMIVEHTTPLENLITIVALAARLLPGNTFSVILMRLKNECTEEVRRQRLPTTWQE